MKKYTSAIIVLAIILFGSLQSCKKKDEKPQHTVYNVDFKTTGAWVVGQAITFHPNDTAGSYLWNFGDGSTSTATSPGHIYTTAGIYTVIMIVANEPSKQVSKQFQVFVDPVYTHQIAGARNWRHQSYTSLSSGWDSTYYYPDAHFAVNYIDPVTVAIGYDTMRYDPNNSNDTMLIFGKTVDTHPAHIRPSSWVIYFDRVSDSIHYTIRPGGSAGGYSYEDYYTKP